MKFSLTLLAALALALSPTQATAQAAHTSPLQLSTSDQALKKSFDWAKAQALFYVSTGHDPAGAWYEAALPGRNAFCMRDVSHQVMGAQALGLAAENKNMLTLFARNIAATRDWTSYWEIDRDGKPSAADYKDDADFWYNLPANFDLMSAALRMYQWTGDQAYIDDPVFLNFYKQTVTEYIHRWQLQPSRVLTRPRIMNSRSNGGTFTDSRGIPSYSEGHKDFILGIDLLAAEDRALRQYSQLPGLHGSKAPASTWTNEADAIERIIEDSGWNAGERHFNGFIRSNGQGFGSADQWVLYFEASHDPVKIAAAVRLLQEQTRQPDPGIEVQSYLPEVLYRYDAPEEAYQQILDLSSPARERREYPEVSFGIIGSIVTGMMGVEVVPSDPSRNRFDLSDAPVVRTLANLSHQTSWVELDHVPVRANLLNIRHEGSNTSSLENLSGPAFTWRATFHGTARSLRVNGKTVRTQDTKTMQGAALSWTDVLVKPGGKISVTAAR